MRLRHLWIGVTAVLAGGGCIPALLPQEFLDLFGLDGGLVTAQSVEPQIVALPAGSEVTRLNGRVTGAQYQLFELPPADPGDGWTIRATDPFARSFVVALFDQDLNLLKRESVEPGFGLQHLVRAQAAKVFAGVTPAYLDNGGSFDLRVSLSHGNPVPAPAAQRVYLNFAGGQGVAVHSRLPVSFGAFRGADLGAQYAAVTDAIVQTVVELVRADYAGYNVEVYSSNETAPPAAPYSTIHFGSDDAGLLGLADNVDEYNQSASQKAMIYVGAFRTFEHMRLSQEAMAVMVANVASHELGHLLGLYHTKDPADVMDTTGSVFDLTVDQSFVRAPLEAGVFPVGFENSPVRLEQTVGLRAGAEKSLSTSRAREKMRSYAALRRLIQEEMNYACGTCADLGITHNR